ncbi:MAG TPA: succinate dehydrogenase cytochrome b subunit [Gemmatimonadales bacterium]|nr:succinate dehydrogenase cytochrome b subunit [Gemmatimonadales bacterium]
MKRLLAFWDSTPGKKVVMGVTGLIMIGFLIMHMLGNLQAFAGPAKLNAYGALLHGPLHELLLLLRVVLLASLVLHVVAATQLTLRDRAARPLAYARKVPQAATLASRTLRVGGVVLLVFIILHLLHFTTGQIHPDFIEGDVYHNLVTGLASPVAAIGYLVAMVAVGLHLYHGAWGSFRSLGAFAPKTDPLHRPVARFVAVVVWLGFSAIPIAVLLGWLR